MYGCVSLHMCRRPGSPEEDTESLGAGSAGDCVLPYRAAGSQILVLHKNIKCSLSQSPLSSPSPMKELHSLAYLCLCTMGACLCHGADGGQKKSLLPPCGFQGASPFHLSHRAAPQIAHLNTGCSCIWFQLLLFPTRIEL